MCNYINYTPHSFPTVSCLYFSHFNNKKRDRFELQTKKRNKMKENLLRVVAFNLVLNNLKTPCPPSCIIAIIIEIKKFKSKTNNLKNSYSLSRPKECDSLFLSFCILESAPLFFSRIVTPVGKPTPAIIKQMPHG